MILRKAETDDLTEIKSMYMNIIEELENSGIQIYWNEFYPCECFADDIKNDRLFLLCDENKIAAAFALCDKCDDDVECNWTDGNAKAMYIGRFGVNVEYRSRGIGGAAIDYAIAFAEHSGAKYVRLLVGTENIPAINLYKKKGFSRINGISLLQINDDTKLYEYGFEKRLF